MSCDSESVFGVCLAMPGDLVYVHVASPCAESYLDRQKWNSWPDTPRLSGMETLRA